jgi:hypothetical protein
MARRTRHSRACGKAPHTWQVKQKHNSIVRLVEWSELRGLRLLANRYWVVFELPKDAASCGRGLLVSPRMSLGRLTGE